MSNILAIARRLCCCIIQRPRQCWMVFEFCNNGFQFKALIDCDTEYPCPVGGIARIGPESCVKVIDRTMVEPDLPQGLLPTALECVADCMLPPCVAACYQLIAPCSSNCEAHPPPQGACFWTDCDPGFQMFQTHLYAGVCWTILDQVEELPVDCVYVPLTPTNGTLFDTCNECCDPGPVDCDFCASNPTVCTPTGRLTLRMPAVDVDPVQCSGVGQACCRPDLPACEVVANFPCGNNTINGSFFVSSTCSTSNAVCGGCLNTSYVGWHGPPTNTQISMFCLEGFLGFPCGGGGVPPGPVWLIVFNVRYCNANSSWQAIFVKFGGQCPQGGYIFWEISGAPDPCCGNNAGCQADWFDKIVVVE